MSTEDQNKEPNGPSGSTADQTQSPAGAEPTFEDLGLSPEELAAFNDMKAPSGDKPPAPYAPPAAAKPAPAAAAEQPGEGEGEDDDDETDEADHGETDADGQPKPKHTRRVALGKHQRIVGKKDEELKALRERVEQQAIREAKINERLAIINEALTTPAGQQQQADPDPEPNPDDIFEHNAWLKRQLQRTNERIEQMATGQQERDQAANQANQIRSFYLQDVQEVVRKEPAFIQAYNFLMNSRDAELEAFGIADPNRRKHIIVSEEQELIRNAIQMRAQGIQASAAETILRLAKLRGFTPQAAGANAAAAAPGAVATQPAANGKAPAQPSTPSVTEEVERLRKAQNASRSLSDGGGGMAKTLDTASLLTLPDEEFADLVAKLPRERLKELMGD